MHMICSKNLSIAFNEEGVKVAFPASFESDKIKGNVLLYRPSNKKFDFNTKIALANSRFVNSQKQID